MPVVITRRGQDTYVMPSSRCLKPEKWNDLATFGTIHLINDQPKGVYRHPLRGCRMFIQNSLIDEARFNGITECFQFRPRLGNVLSIMNLFTDHSCQLYQKNKPLSVFQLRVVLATLPEQLIG